MLLHPKIRDKPIYYSLLLKNVILCTNKINTLLLYSRCQFNCSGPHLPWYTNSNSIRRDCISYILTVSFTSDQTSNKFAKFYCLWSLLTTLCIFCVQQNLLQSEKFPLLKQLIAYTIYSGTKTKQYTYSLNYFETIKPDLLLLPPLIVFLLSILFLPHLHSTWLLIQNRFFTKLNPHLHYRIFYFIGPWVTVNVFGSTLQTYCRYFYFYFYFYHNEIFISFLMLRCGYGLGICYLSGQTVIVYIYGFLQLVPLCAPTPLFIYLALPNLFLLVGCVPEMHIMVMGNGLLNHGHTTFSHNPYLPLTHDLMVIYTEVSEYLNIAHVSKANLTTNSKSNKHQKHHTQHCSNLYATFYSIKCRYGLFLLMLTGMGGLDSCTAHNRCFLSIVTYILKLLATKFVARTAMFASIYAANLKSLFSFFLFYDKIYSQLMNIFSCCTVLIFGKLDLEKLSGTDGLSGNYFTDFTSGIRIRLFPAFIAAHYLNPGYIVFAAESENITNKYLVSDLKIYVVVFKNSKFNICGVGGHHILKT